MGTVAKLRLKSALEELQARSTHPVVRRQLLEDLLIQVDAGIEVLSLSPIVQRNTTVSIAFTHTPGNLLETNK